MWETAVLQQAISAWENNQPESTQTHLQHALQLVLEKSHLQPPCFKERFGNACFVTLSSVIAEKSLFKRLTINPALEEVLMKKKVSVFLLIGIALLLVFVAFGSQSIVSAKENWPTVPFKVNCVTYPDVVSGPGYLEVEIPSDCKGTHVGNGEWYADSIVNVSVPPPFPQTGDMVFTAANGDQLIGTFAGLGVPNELGGFNYWGEYWITEGTGGFSGVTGYGTYDGGADGEVGTAVFVGTLTKKPGHFGNP